MASQQINVKDRCSGGTKKNTFESVEEDGAFEPRNEINEPKVYWVWDLRTDVSPGLNGCLWIPNGRLWRCGTKLALMHLKHIHLSFSNVFAANPSGRCLVSFFFLHFTLKRISIRFFCCLLISYLTKHIACSVNTMLPLSI